MCIAVVVRAVLALDVVVGVAAGPVALCARVLVRYAFMFSGANNVGVMVTVPGRARGLLLPSAAILVVLPSTLLGIAPFLALRGGVGGDAAQQRDRHQECREGHCLA